MRVVDFWVADAHGDVGSALVRLIGRQDGSLLRDDAEPGLFVCVVADVVGRLLIGLNCFAEGCHGAVEFGGHGIHERGRRRGGRRRGLG